MTKNLQEEISHCKGENLLLTCQNFIGLQEPSNSPAELIFLAKNTNSNGFLKNSWYGKDENLEFLELDDSKKNTRNNFFAQQLQDIKTPENKLSTLHTATNSKSSQDSNGKPIKKIKYFENFQIPFQSQSQDTKKNSLNEKIVNRKIINLDYESKGSSDSNLVSSNRETLLHSSKSKASGISNAFSNKNSERAVFNNKFEIDENKDLNKNLCDYIQTLNAFKTSPHKTNFSIPEKEVKNILPAKIQELEDTNCYIKDFIDICNRKQSSMEEVSPRININFNNLKERVINLSTIDANSVHNISVLNNMERTKSQAKTDVPTKPIVIETNYIAPVRDNQKKKVSLPLSRKSNFTNNINIYLNHNKKENDQIKVNELKNQNSRKSLKKENLLTSSKEYRLINIEKRNVKKNISPESQKPKCVNLTKTIDENKETIYNNYEDGNNNYDDHLMTSEYVNLGTRPNGDTSRNNEFMIKNINFSLDCDEKINTFKEINHCEIDLFSSSNMSKTDNNKFSVENSIYKTKSKIEIKLKDSCDTEKNFKPLYPVVEKNIDFIVESPQDNSKNSNEVNETKIKETNFVNYNFENPKVNYNDTITSNMSNNYMNKIENQNRTIINLENLKFIMSIENLDSTNKNLIDLTNRNMVNSYISNKNYSETEKREFLKKLMYFSNKNNSMINNISPSNSNAPNSKNISPKRKQEEITSEKINEEKTEKQNPFNIYAAEINLFDEDNKIQELEKENYNSNKDMKDNKEFFLNKRKNKYSVNVIKNRLLSSNILNSHDESLLENYNQEEGKKIVREKKISKSFSQKNEEGLEKIENASLIKKELKIKVTKVEKNNKKNLNKPLSKNIERLKSPILVNDNKIKKEQKTPNKEKEGLKKQIINLPCNSIKSTNVVKNHLSQSKLVANINKSKIDLNKDNSRKEVSKFKQGIKRENNENFSNNDKLENKINNNIKKKIIVSGLNSIGSSIHDKSNPLINSYGTEQTNKMKLEIESNNYEIKSGTKSPSNITLYDYTNFSMDILNDGKKKRQAYLRKYNELNSIFSNTLLLIKNTQKISKDNIKYTLDMITESQEVYENELKENFKELNLNESSIYKD